METNWHQWWRMNKRLIERMAQSGRTHWSWCCLGNRSLGRMSRPCAAAASELVSRFILMIDAAASPIDVVCVCSFCGYEIPLKKACSWKQLRFLEHQPMHGRFEITRFVERAFLNSICAVPSSSLRVWSFLIVSPHSSHFRIFKNPFPRMGCQM